MNTHRLVSLGASHALLMLAVLSPAGSTRAIAGDEPADRFSALVNRATSTPETSEAPPMSIGKPAPLRWWSIPWRAHIAMRRAAAAEDARITRATYIEGDEQVIYQIRAKPRRKLLSSEDFVLIQFSEPRADVEARREARSLSGRLERFRQRLRPAASSILP